ncbi:MAG TPA: sugar ABC transporter substrate-binding protein [Chloroflexota bacterium]|nr:sugar ABC transporter substrate-binding protein [Chloroflexota bacterium]
MKIRRHSRTWLLAFIPLILALGGVASTPRAFAGRSDAGMPTIGFLQIDLTNPFHIDQGRGAVEAGRRFGYNLLDISAHGSVNEQIQEFQTLINQHVAAIMVNPIDISAFGPSLDKARAAHIPVLVLYSGSPKATMNSGFDEFQTGQMVGKYSIQLLTKKYGKPQGQVAVLQGLLGQGLNADRTGGFTSVMAKYPGIKVVSQEPTDWLPDKAAAAMQDWLVRYPKLAMVYGLSDTLTVPAINVAARAQKAGGIIFTSVDGDPIGLTAIQQGKMACTAMYAPIYAGFRFGEMAVNLAKHKAEPKTENLNSFLVTPANVNAAAKAEAAMSNSIKTFGFDKTLAQLVANYSH